jgi:hypothetical protein
MVGLAPGGSSPTRRMGASLVSFGHHSHEVGIATATALLHNAGVCLRPGGLENSHSPQTYVRPIKPQKSQFAAEAHNQPRRDHGEHFPRAGAPQDQSAEASEG